MQAEDGAVVQAAQVTAVEVEKLPRRHVQSQRNVLTAIDVGAHPTVFIAQNDRFAGLAGGVDADGHRQHNTAAQLRRAAYKDAVRHRAVVAAMVLWSGGKHMIPCQRRLFDIPEDVSYLNCAYMSPLPLAGRDAGEAAILRKCRPWTIQSEHFFADSEAVRALVARLLAADADDVAIVPAVSYAAAVASRNLRLVRGQKILLLQEQFPSNVYAWRELAKETGAVVETVQRPTSGDWTQAILEHIDASVGVAALPNCHWVDGGLVDLVAVGQALRAVGAALFVDASQSLGVVPLDVKRVQPDFVACAGYKWLLGPYSLGFLYVAKSYHTGTPLEHNWISRIGAEDFSRLAEYRDELQPGARRFDVGERANILQMPIMRAGLELVLGWDADEIQATLRAITDVIAAKAASLGIAAAPRALRAPHYLGLRFPAERRQKLLAELEARQVHVSARGEFLRVTPYLYNDEADVQKLCEALDAALASFSSF